MQLGVEGPAGAVGEGGDELALGVDLEAPRLAGPDEAGVLVEEGDGRLDGGVVGGSDRGAQLGPAEGPEQRDALRGRERDRVAGHGVPGRGLAEPLERAGVAGLAEEGGHLVGRSLAVEPGGGRAPAEPAPGLLAAAGPVVLGAVGDLGGVVTPAAGAEAPVEAEHLAARNGSGNVDGSPGTAGCSCVVPCSSRRSTLRFYFSSSPLSPDVPVLLCLCLLLLVPLGLDRFDSDIVTFSLLFSSVAIVFVVRRRARRTSPPIGR